MKLKLNDVKKWQEEKLFFFCFFLSNALKRVEITWNIHKLTLIPAITCVFSFHHSLTSVEISSSGKKCSHGALLQFLLVHPYWTFAITQKQQKQTRALNGNVVASWRVSFAAAAAVQHRTGKIGKMKINYSFSLSGWIKCISIHSL